MTNVDSLIQAQVKIGADLLKVNDAFNKEPKIRGKDQNRLKQWQVRATELWQTFEAGHEKIVKHEAEYAASDYGQNKNYDQVKIRYAELIEKIKKLQEKTGQQRNVTFANASSSDRVTRSRAAKEAGTDENQQPKQSGYQQADNPETDSLEESEDESWMAENEASQDEFATPRQTPFPTMVTVGKSTNESGGNGTSV